MARPTGNKYGARRTEVDGITFASQAEARRYGELKLLERGGTLSHLEVQPRFPLVVNGVRVCIYVADFGYLDTATGARVVEDVKSTATKTPVYRLKKHLMWAVFGIAIVEVQA